MKCRMRQDVIVLDDLGTHIEHDMIVNFLYEHIGCLIHFNDVENLADDDFRITKSRD